MSSNDIARIIDSTLDDLFHRLDQLELDEVDLEIADGKIVITFADGVKYIVNRQGAADQIWLAEPGGGWHYDYVDGRWIDAKRGVELYDSLNSLMRSKLGDAVDLR